MPEHDPHNPVELQFNDCTIGQAAKTINNRGSVDLFGESGRPAPRPARGPTEHRPTHATPGTVVSIDIVGSSRGSRAAQGRLDRSLDRVVDDALAESPYRREDWFRRPDGDSITLVAGATVAKGWIAADFIRALEIHLRRVNEGIVTAERLRLRIAIAHGEIEIERPHVRGPAVRLAARLRDAGPVRRQAAQADDSLTLAVSEQFYRDVVCEGDRDLDPACFWRFTTRVKDGTLSGWCRRAAAPLAEGGRR